MKYLLVIITLFPCIALAQLQQSICYGTTAKGKLQHGVKLPEKGNNFKSYSYLAGLAGRTYVHSEVSDIVVDAYKILEAEQPAKVYKYAETGFKTGGQFSPHKTHQNGLSVDFMTPVTNSQGQSVHLPTHIFNKLGYSIEFDETNSYQKLHIDFEAIAAHIVALHLSAKKMGYDLWRVIFDPELQPYLYQTQYADYLRQHISFSQKSSWVRHDEHYHVDFQIPCQP